MHGKGIAVVFADREAAHEAPTLRSHSQQEALCPGSMPNECLPPGRGWRSSRSGGATSQAAAVTPHPSGVCGGGWLSPASSARRSTAAR
jgi:hypothetical protein